MATAMHHGHPQQTGATNSAPPPPVIGVKAPASRISARHDTKSAQRLQRYAKPYYHPPWAPSVPTSNLLQKENTPNDAHKCVTPTWCGHAPRPRYALNPRYCAPGVPSACPTADLGTMPPVTRMGVNVTWPLQYATPNYCAYGVPSDG